MTKKVEKNIIKFIDFLTKVTVRISTFNEEGILIGRSSGFLYQPEKDKIPLIITAGHKLPESGSFIETSIVKDGKLLLINAGKFNVFYKNDDVDYAYCELPVEIYKQDIEKFIDVEFIVYKDKFINVMKNEAYGFAVVNDYAEFVRSENGFLLSSYCCFEVGLELVKQDENINYFKLAGDFQGHEYYQGASGSPIADPEGAITSILIGGCQETGLLKATRLDNISF
jgi:hypothetical protein